MPTKLITGQPGNGKTLYAVSLILEAKKTGRPIYSNINGLDIEGVEPIPVNAKGELDWTLTEQGDEATGVYGALVVYDETQKLPYFAYKSKEKLSSNPLITELEDHRHFAYDFIFITQSPKFLHLHLLELVNEHYHVKRPMNRAQAEIHKHRGYSMNPETVAAQERAEDIFKFAYPKELFQFYKSTEIVTNSKIQIPKYIKKLIFIIVACLLGIIYLVFFKDNQIFGHMMGKDKEPKKVETTQSKDSTGGLIANAVTGAKPDLNIECRKGVNVEKPECVAWFNNLTKSNGSVQSMSINGQQVEYDPTQPFKTDQIQKEITYTVTAKPVFSGCTKFNGKYQAYTQQGTKLEVSQSDCKNLIENNDRPFNYFAQGQQNGLNNSSNITTNNQVSSQQNTAQTVQKMTLEQYAKYIQYLEDQNQANNQIQRGLEHNFLVAEPYKHS